jgi:lipopolysaccharide heptosyltransferase I
MSTEHPSTPLRAGSALSTEHAAQRRILIVRLGSLGDLIHTLPAVAAIRDAWPDAEIDWIVERAHADLLALVPVLSRVVVLGDRSAGGWWSAIRTLRARRYDLAVDLQGLVKSAAIARLSGARRVVGFDRSGLREPAARFFYSEVVPVGEGRHVIQKNLALVRHALGGHFSLTDEMTSELNFASELNFPLRIPDSPALAAIRAKLQDLKTPGPQDPRTSLEFVVLNPGAAWPNKRWPPGSFAQVACAIRDRHGWSSVVLWGPGEAGIAQAVVDGSGGAAVLAPATTLADLLAIASAARVFVSGDTGPLHLAGAVGTPLVALFGPTTAARNGPWDDRDVSISRYDGCACHYKRVCHRPATWCLAGITVDDVMDAVARRLGHT